MYIYIYIYIYISFTFTKFVKLNNTRGNTYNKNN